MPSNIGLKIGDIVLVFNRRTNKHAFAIFADENDYVIGEGSAKLAEKLGIQLFKTDYYYCDTCRAYRTKIKCNKCKRSCSKTVCKSCKLVSIGNNKKLFVYIIFENSTKADINTGLIKPEYLTEKEIDSRGNLIANKYGGVEAMLKKIIPLIQTFSTKPRPMTKL